MPLSVSLFVILSVSFLFGRLARRFYFSEVIGLIVVGILLTMPPLRDYTIAGHDGAIMSLARAGMLALLFLSGLEVSGNTLYREEKSAAAIALSTFFASLFLGTAVMMALGYDAATAVTAGICFGITAEATKGRALLQLGKLKTKIGSLIMGTGITNDAIGVLFFILTLYFFTREFVYGEIVILAEAIAAFAAGIAAHYAFNRFSRLVRTAEAILLYGLVPFFFVGLGAYFHLNFWQAGLLLPVIVFLTASAGQMAGVLVVAPVVRLSGRQLYLVGWAMNSRGAVDLAVAFIALQAGFLPPALYSAIVITALAGTVLFQAEMFRLVRKDPGIMD